MDEFFSFLDTISERRTWERVVMVLVGAGLLYLALTWPIIRWRR